MTGWTFFLKSFLVVAWKSFFSGCGVSETTQPLNLRFPSFFLKTVRSVVELFGIQCSACTENNTSVEFDSSLIINNELDGERVLILKPDNYYNSSRMHNPPPSPDCLILIHYTEQEHYDLYLIELKDVKNPQELRYKIIVEKFKTMIDRFFPEFEAIFNSVNYKIIKFYLVTTYPKGGGQLSSDDYQSRIAGSVLDAYGSQKPLKLFNKAVVIVPKPSPLLISHCNLEI